MDEQKISKEIRKVVFTLADGHQVEGEVFLSLFGAHHTGQQRVGDLLNDGENFLPVKTAQGFFLLNVRQIMAAKVGEAGEKDELMLLGQKYTVGITTVSGQELIADVHVNLPQTSSRVKDFFNQPQKFFRVFQGKDILYLNADYILYVKD